MLSVVGAILVALSCSTPPERSGRQVETELIGSDGNLVGSASLQETQAGVRVAVRVGGLPEGSYRYAIFENPVCEAPDFLTVGQPFPAGAETGMLRNMSPALNRSIGRLEVGIEGTGRAEEVAPVVTLGSGENSLFHGGGSSLVVLQRPAGGARVACGAIRP
jgi:Cu-Zn family superoxide dismutase